MVKLKVSFWGESGLTIELLLSRTKSPDVWRGLYLRRRVTPGFRKRSIITPFNSYLISENRWSIAFSTNPSLAAKAVAAVFLKVPSKYSRLSHGSDNWSCWWIGIRISSLLFKFVAEYGSCVWYSYRVILSSETGSSVTCKTSFMI